MKSLPLTRRVVRLQRSAFQRLVTAVQSAADALFRALKPAAPIALAARRAPAWRGVTPEPLESRRLLAADLLDLTFGGGDGLVTSDINGNDMVADIAVLGGGKMIAVGYSAPPGKMSAFAIARYNANGTVDTTFGGGDGVVTVDVGPAEDAAEAVIPLAGGKLLITGEAMVEGKRKIGLVRLNANGSIDGTFGGGDGKVVTSFGALTDDSVEDLLALPDGDIVVVGTSVAADYSERVLALARFNANGSRDTSWGDDGIVTANLPGEAEDRGSALVRGPGSTFYVAGASGARGLIARYRFDGSLDSGFADDGMVFTGDYFAEVYGRTGMAIAANGDLLLSSRYYGDTNVARFQADGSPVSSFGIAGETTFWNPGWDGAYGDKIAELPDGKIVVGLGNFTVARLTSDGYADPTFDGEDGMFAATFPNTNTSGNAMAVQADGRVLLGGTIIESTGLHSNLSQFGIARLKNLQVTAPADPDDQISEAGTLTIGGARSGTISAGTDVDMYKLTVAEGQRIALDIDRPAGSNLDSVLRVFTSQAGEVVSNDDGVGVGEVAGTGESFLRVFFEVGGTYYIGVSGSANGSYDPASGHRDVTGSTGGYMLRAVNVPPPVDPDDQFSEAASYSVAAGPRSASISDDLDVDVVKFTATAGQRLGIDVDVTGQSTLNPYLRLYDAGGIELASVDDQPAPGETAGVDAYVEWTFQTAGTYYVVISSNVNTGSDPITGDGDRPGGTGSYSLDLVPVSIPADPDDQVSEAIAIAKGVARAGEIGVRDVDMYKFTSAAGREIQADIAIPASSLLSANIRLIRESGEYLQEYTANPGDAPSSMHQISWYTDVSGTYYIAVAGSGNYGYDPITGENDLPGSKGTYQLTVTTPLAPAGDDPDDQIVEARSIPAGTADASLDFPTDVDLYGFNAAVSESIEFNVTTTAGSPDTRLRLFDAAGSVLADNDDWYGYDPFVSYEFEAAGRYYIGVSTASNGNYDPVSGGGDYNGGGTGPYRVVITRLGTDTDDQISEAVAVGDGAVRAGAVGTSKDVDMFRVTVAAGQEWVFQARATTELAPMVRLFRADGEMLAVDQQWDTTASIRYSFNAAGTYYLGVSSSSNPGYDPITGRGDEIGSIGAYELTVRKLGPDTDDQLGEAATLSAGVVKSGTIFTESDVDLYRFQATARTPVVIDLDRPAGGIADARLRIFDAEGFEVGGSVGTSAPDEAPNREAYREFVPEVSGVYFVGVSAGGNYNYSPVTGQGDRNGGATGAYTLEVRGLDADADDTIAEAVLMSTSGSRTAAVDTRYDVDMIKFTVTAGQRIGIDLDRPAGSTLDSVLRLFNSSGSELRFDDDTAAPGESLGVDPYIEYVFSRSGTYYVGISAAGNSGYDPVTGTQKRAGVGTGGYTLRLTRLS